MTMTDAVRHNPNTAGAWVLGIVAGIAVIVSAYYVTSTSQRMDTFAANQAAMQRDIAWIRAGMTDIYTGAEAKEAHKRLYRTDQDLYNRINGIESRVEVLEDQVR